MSDTSCIASCGIQSGILDIDKERNRSPTGLGDAMNMMQTLCKWVFEIIAKHTHTHYIRMYNCVSPCQASGYKSVCNSDKPAMLMHDMSVMLLNKTYEKLNIMGMGFMYPNECRMYSGMEAVETSGGGVLGDLCQ
jgi:hypothetical protein